MGFHRQIVLDTETTGLSPDEGHRIIEIGAVELVGRSLTGNDFHRYINPERDVSKGALAVHGLDEVFLKDQPRFVEVVADLVAYLEGAELIIHNAPFDVGFLDYELKLLGEVYREVGDYCTVFDTLTYARKRHPGQRNSLDALCERYGVDRSHRSLHGALLDAHLLVDVFLAMTGGQRSLFGEEDDEGGVLGVGAGAGAMEAVVAPVAVAQEQVEGCVAGGEVFSGRVIRASEAEVEVHAGFLREKGLVDF